MVSQGEGSGRNRFSDKMVNKFLCGHDERDWFVATAASNVTTVAGAKESLKPVEVVQKQVGIKGKKRNKRHNPVFKRQGEWFFVPAPDLILGKHDIIRKSEPISRSGRGGGKPHVCEELVRYGGRTVWSKRNSGAEPISDGAYKRLTLEGRIGYTARSLNPTAYVRGRITHPDHATIKLTGWHKVMQNNERSVSGMAFDFID